MIEKWSKKPSTQQDSQPPPQEFCSPVIWSTSVLHLLPYAMLDGSTFPIKILQAITRTSYNTNLIIESYSFYVWLFRSEIILVSTTLAFHLSIQFF